jgi:hypothetical protein
MHLTINRILITFVLLAVGGQGLLAAVKETPKMKTTIHREGDRV